MPQTSKQLADPLHRQPKSFFPGRILGCVSHPVGGAGGAAVNRRRSVSIPACALLFNMCIFIVLVVMLSTPPNNAHTGLPSLLFAHTFPFSCITLNPFCHCSFIHGRYVKYNNNSDWTEGKRDTPQAFSHWTYIQSEKQLMIVNIKVTSGHEILCDTCRAFNSRRDV
jgi:hypothetical protein